MFDFLNLEPETFGLDINDTSLKIIKLKKKRGFLMPVSFAEKDVVLGVTENGIIKDEEAFVKGLKSVLADVKGEKLKTKYVVASLPEEKSFSQVIKMPKMSDEELKTAVPFEAENYIPLPAEQMYLDFKKMEPIVDHLDHLDVFIVAVEKSLVDSYVKTLKEAGLIPFAFEVETQAIARALIKNNTSLAPVALVDFGRDTTDFIVFSGHSVKFTSSIPVSSRQLSEKISKDLGVKMQEAEGLKIRHGIGGGESSHKANAVLKSILPELDNLSKEIKKYLDFYASHDFHDHLSKDGSAKYSVQKIILSGGGSRLKGLDAYLNKKFNMPVEFGNPWINFAKVPELKQLDELRENPLSFTTALGLALRKNA